MVASELKSRRFILGMTGVVGLLVLGFYLKDVAVGISVATIIGAVAGANAWEARTQNTHK